MTKVWASTAWRDLDSARPGLGAAYCVLLAGRGIDATHVSEMGMAEADDAQILEAARFSGRVCVTLDHDFHSHLAVAGLGRPSVILLRAEGLNVEAQADLIVSICLQCELALTEGAAIAATFPDPRQ